MERKAFLKTCGMACLGGGSLFALLLEGCASGSKMVNGTIVESNLQVPVSDFQTSNGHFHQYLVVRHDQLRYPVCVYRFSETSYTALYMRCPHQGAELQVFGDRLQCPAHGSEFNDKGVVKTGPADTNLRTFTTSINKDQLLISLK
jgi:nitrite reductase/ring-hydroxylating ferredoxin subunit